MWSSFWSPTLVAHPPAIFFSLFYCKSHCVCLADTLFWIPLLGWCWTVLGGWSFRCRLPLTLLWASFCFAFGFAFGFGLRLTFAGGSLFFRGWSPLWCLWVVFVFYFVRLFFFLFLWLFGLLFFSQFPLFRAHSLLGDTFCFSFMADWFHICLFRFFLFFWFFGSSWSLFTCSEMSFRVAIS